MLRRFTLVAYAAALLAFSSPARAQSPADLDDNAHFLVMGDSLSAGEGALPATQGYAYLLYSAGIFSPVLNTTFASAAMPGATSEQVLKFEAPLAAQSGFLFPSPPDDKRAKNPARIIVMTVGGNDLLTLIDPTKDPAVVIGNFAANMSQLLASLCRFPNARIYVGNLYEIRNFPVSTTAAVLAFNKALADVVGAVNAQGLVCPGNVKVADVYSQFLGDQRDLLLINRRGADKFEVHPTNAGHRAMARAFFLAR